MSGIITIDVGAYEDNFIEFGLKKSITYGSNRNTMDDVILIVDDAPLIRQLVKILLTDEGYFIIEAESVHTALTMLSGTTPRMVITDINMPGSNGVELISHIRANNTMLPILVLSSDVRKTLQDECRIAGATAMMDKLHIIDYLCDTVNVLLKQNNTRTHDNRFPESPRYIFLNR
ncbi:MAG: response regulator [Spirochaetes bacterium]|nr:response regulator [Spirochaetota bacterium]